MFLLVDLSQRDICVMRPGGSQVLPFMDFERNFPTQMYKIFSRFPDIYEVIVINGPGSFTTLRIGCLTLNLIQLRRKSTLRFHPITKKDLYIYAYQQGVLPRHGLMRIGQSKNARSCDLETGETTKIRMEDGLLRDGWRDYIYESDAANISLEITERLSLKYGEKTLDIQDFCMTRTEEFLMPEYMVEW